MKAISFFLAILFSSVSFFSQQSDLENDLEYFSLNIFVNYPRFISSDIPPRRLNYGFGAGFEYGLNKSISYSYQIGYNYLTLDQAHKSTIFAQDISINYFPLSIFSFSPVFSLGAGALFFKATNFEMMIKYKLVLTFGFIQNLSETYSVSFGASYNLTNTDALDGKAGNIFKSGYNDVYLSAFIGIKYFFSYNATYSKNYSQNFASSNVSSSSRYITEEQYERLIYLFETVLRNSSFAENISKTDLTTSRKQNFVEQKNETELEKEEKSNKKSGLSEVDYDKIKSDVESKIIFFNSDNKIELSAYLIIDDVGKILTKYPEVKIEIIGHADVSYSEQKAEALSIERAEFIKNIFVKMGINSERLIVVSKGKSEPRFQKNNSSNRNNRVEFRLIL